jgi:hypothetical protein
MNQSLTVDGAPGSGRVPVEAAPTLIGRPYDVVEGATWEHDPQVLARLEAVNPLRQIPALFLAALLATTPVAVTADPARARPFRLRCEIDHGNPQPTVQFYRLDPAAGEVLAEPGSLYTRAGVRKESEALVRTNTVESWTGDEVVFRFEARSKTGPQTATYREILNLKTLTLRLENTTRLSSMTLRPSTYHGRCRRVAMDAPP